MFRTLFVAPIYRHGCGGIGCCCQHCSSPPLRLSPGPHSHCCCIMGWTLATSFSLPSEPQIAASYSTHRLDVFPYSASAMEFAELHLDDRTKPLQCHDRLPGPRPSASSRLCSARVKAAYVTWDELALSTSNSARQAHSFFGL